MRLLLFKKRIVSVLGILLSVALLTGCQYSSLDEYLELLGMKDSYHDEPADTADSSVNPYAALENYSGNYSGIQDDNSVTDLPFDGSEAENPEGIDETSATDSSENEDDSLGEDGKYFSTYKQLTESELNEEMKAARDKAGISNESLDKLKQSQ